MRGKMKKSNVKGKNKQEDPKKIGLELQEYVFDGQTPSKYASKEYWLNSYIEKADKNFDETVKIYEEVKQLPYPNVTLKTVRDHATNTPSLAMTVGNKVSEVNVNLEIIPTTDIIHLNRETSDILNTGLLKATL